MGNDKNRRQLREEAETIADFRRKAPKVKAHLRAHGCDLPFYDYLDSYEAEFQRAISFAKTNYSSLVGVHEVDDGTLDSDSWSRLGYGTLTQVFFDIDVPVSEYLGGDKSSNLHGKASFFTDDAGKLRTGIQIANPTKLEVQHRELKYAFKIGALWHEIGHVHDAENGINFNLSAKSLSLIEAEVFAHLYAFEKLAERCLRRTYLAQFNAIQDATTKDGCGGEVARKVMERLPERKLVDWHDFLP